MGAVIQYLVRKAYAKGHREGYRDGYNKGIIKVSDMCSAINAKMREGLSIDESMAALNVPEAERPLYKKVLS